MVRRFFLIAVLTVLCGMESLFAQSLAVQDPQRTFRYGRGTIEEATLTVRPKGIYMEYGLYLTVSARGTGYTSPSDQLEIQFYFNLPNEAVVTDSWLWVGNDIVQGKLMDRNAASLIYESIVQRRRDPSILSKTGAGRYELRVYPLIGNETRKVKITYLMPTQWTGNVVSAALPLNLLRTSLYPTPLTLAIWSNQVWKAPSIDELTDVKFSTATDLVTKNDLLFTTLATTTLARTSSLTLSMPSPMKDGIYFNHYNDGTEGFYQLAFLPSQALGIVIPKKTAVLFDYDPTKSSLSIPTMLATVKSYLRSSLMPRDSFNLIYSQLSVKRYSQVWLPADSATIERAFASLSNSFLAMYSNLPPLLESGITFVKSKGEDGSIVLVANSDQASNQIIANQLLTDLRALTPKLPPIHIADFTSQNYSGSYIGGTWYPANEYFYSTLARLSNGSYNTIRTSSNFPSLIASRFDALNGVMTVFDFYTTMKSGFCYARYNLSAATQAISAPVVQTGKYNGTIPFIVQASGLMQSKPFSKTIELGQSTAFFGDTTNKAIWAGNYIRSLETTAQQNNATMREIVDNSLQYRVLSLYTAFLALEPNDTVKPCTTCRDESKLSPQQTAVNTTVARDTALLAASPNPFTTETTLSAELPSGTESHTVTFDIYNVLGQKIRTLQTTESGTGSSKRLSARWLGDDGSGEKVRVGIYFFAVSTPTNRFMLKIIKIE